MRQATPVAAGERTGGISAEPDADMASAIACAPEAEAPLRDGSVCNLSAPEAKMIRFSSITRYIRYRDSGWLHPGFNFVNNTVGQIVGPHPGHHRHCEYSNTDPARQHSLVPQLSGSFVGCFEQPNGFHDRPHV